MTEFAELEAKILELCERIDRNKELRESAWQVSVNGVPMGFMSPIFIMPENEMEELLLDMAQALYLSKQQRRICSENHVVPSDVYAPGSACGHHGLCRCGKCFPDV